MPVSKIDISYNTAKEDVRFPEYGRSIQEMLHYACTIEDPRKRLKTVEAIIQMMMQLNPNSRNVEDYKEKLWNHAFAITNYQLDVPAPPNITIRKEEDRTRPSKVPYPNPTLRFRHYGQNVQTLIAKAIEMPDGPKKEGFVEVIASYMKLAYKTWNREHYVSDDVVKDDLEALSEGQLELHEGHSSLDTLAMSATRREKEMHRQGRNRKNGNNNNNKKNRGGGNNNNNNNNRNYGYRKRKK